MPEVTFASPPMAIYNHLKSLPLKNRKEWLAKNIADSPNIATFSIVIFGAAKVIAEEEGLELCYKKL